MLVYRESFCSGISCVDGSTAMNSFFIGIRCNMDETWNKTRHPVEMNISVYIYIHIYICIPFQFIILSTLLRKMITCDVSMNSLQSITISICQNRLLIKSLSLFQFPNGVAPFPSPSFLFPHLLSIVGVYFNLLKPSRQYTVNTKQAHKDKTNWIHRNIEPCASIFSQQITHFI